MTVTPAGPPLAPDRLPGGWDRVAAEYEHAVVPMTAKFAADALRVVPVGRGSRVLDVATGTGALALEAARRAAEVTAIDFSPQMVERLRAVAVRQGLSNLRPFVMDGQALTLPDASFDAAFSVFGLIFFADRLGGLREMHRVLVPEARAAIVAWSSPDKVRFMSVLSAAAKQVAPDLPPPAEPPAIFSLRDPEQIGREMTAAGFHDIDVYTVTHEWVHASPAAFWDATNRVSPVFQSLLERIGGHRVPAFRDAVVQLVEDEFGRGPVRLPGEAHIAVGTK